MSKRLPIPKDAKLTHVGYFEVECGRVHITDPCYKEGTWCSAPNIIAVNGLWNANVIRLNQNEWGNRNMHLIAYCCSENIQDILNTDDLWQALPNSIGVDSGQCGIFDAKKYQYPDRDKWYDMICNTTNDHGVIPGGCATRSRYGDGGYTAEVATDNKGRVFAIHVSFADIDAE